MFAKDAVGEVRECGIEQEGQDLRERGGVDEVGGFV